MQTALSAAEAAKYVALGSAVTYGTLIFLGYLPLWFGPEVRAWSRANWDEPARRVLEELEKDPDYWRFSMQESTRNFLMTGPFEDSTPNRRVRRVVYFSRRLGKLRGVVHFGADCEGPPRCVHGGCISAVCDALLGVTAYRTARMPCVTANLNVNYRDKIPLGSQVGVECVQVALPEGGLRKSKFSFKLYSLDDPNKVFADGDALFINAAIPSGKNGSLLPAFLKT